MIYTLLQRHRITGNNLDRSLAKNNVRSHVGVNPDIERKRKEIEDPPNGESGKSYDDQCIQHTGSLEVLMRRARKDPSIQQKSVPLVLCFPLDGDICAPVEGTLVVHVPVGIEWRSDAVCRHPG